ncbi:hypothetical protein ACXU4B_10815 [Dyella soli]|uniref:Uncharacterized protein n=1 Tax=Dyella soli TaxID=522319 RepID=A0A4R0YR46_9GAMM|nr:hypothetical protein [Dyella soli]TCI07331.1 hypothetical protein EZM97_32605 [Dyella soli]
MSAFDPKQTFAERERPAYEGMVVSHSARVERGEMRCCFWVIVLLLTVALPVGAQGVTQRVTGIYSDLHYNKEGGDLLGMELLIVPSDSSTKEPGYTVFVQIAEGGAPITAVVPLDVRGSKIEFTLPEGDPAYGKMHFVGVMTKSAIVLHSEHGAEKGDVETLTRGKSYWQ